MLPKTNRLTKKEIIAFLPNAKTIRGNLLFLKYRLGRGLSEVKVGASVSKKVINSAVERNKQRRLIYRVVKTNFKDIPVGQFFFIFNKTGNREEIEAEIVSLLQKVRPETNF